MDKSLTFMQWFNAVLELLHRPEITVEIVISEKQSWFGYVVALCFVHDHVTVVRKYVLYALEKNDGEIVTNDINDYLDGYERHFGVISEFFLTNADISNEANELLHDRGFTYAKIASDEGGHYSMPEMDKSTNFYNMILGGMIISEINSSIEQLRSKGLDSNQSLSSEESLARLRGLYMAILMDYLSLKNLIYSNTDGCEHVASETEGTETYLSPSYGICESKNSSFDALVFIPDCQSLYESVNRSLTILHELPHLNIPSDYTETKTLLRELSILIINYIISVLYGYSSVIDLTDLKNHFVRIRQAPHAMIICFGLEDLEVLEQLHRLDIVGCFELIDCQEDVVKLMSVAMPKVQVECFKTLENLKFIGNPSSFAQYFEHSGDLVRRSAASLIASFRTEDAANYILSMIQKGMLKLDAETLETLAKTGSDAALGFLLSSCKYLNGDGPMIATEICLHNYTKDGFTTDKDLEIDQEELLSLCKRLFDEKEFSPLAKRLALKLIAVFKANQGIPYILKSLEDDDIQTRINGIKAAKIFATDELVEAIWLSVTKKPEDYSSKPLIEWMYSRMWYQGKGPYGPIRSIEDLDIDKVAAMELRSIGTDRAIEFATRIEKDLFAANEDASKLNYVSNPIDVVSFSRAVALKESIFRSKDNITVWVKAPINQDDAIAFACIVHDGEFSSSTNMASSAAMLGGGISMTSGTGKQLMRDVVRPILRGEEPILPLSVGMGEFKSIALEDLKKANNVSNSNAESIS